jgi:ABC-type polysaccharide/polyol phosphate export permease
MKALLSDLFRARYVLKTMVIKDLKARYIGSLFGPLWIIATPLYQILLYTFLFSTIMKVRFEDGAGTSSFVVYLLAGLIPWLFFSEATIRGISTFIENAHIIKKVKFPMEICVASVVVSSAVTFFVYIVFYLAMLVIMGLLKVETFPLLILPFAIQVLLISGLSFGLGSMAVFFRDVTQIAGMALNLVFFLTPIVYPTSAIPEKVRWVFDINPFYYVYPSVVALTIFLAGYYFFRRTKEAFTDIL